MDASCKKSLRMTSYGGIIRIRLKGRSLITSSQPAKQAPLYLFSHILYIAFHKNTIVFSRMSTLNISALNLFKY